MSGWFLICILFFGSGFSSGVLAQGDLFEVASDPVRVLADSTVALISKDKVQASSNGTFLFAARSFGERFNLCSSEPFRDQNSLAFCSGVLVTPDTVLTAGHCVEDGEDCEEMVAAFGFDQGSSVQNSEVYRCAQVIHSEDTDGGSDFALLRLDRAVTGHRPLSFRQQGTIEPGASILMIGHPSGLPTKVSYGSVADAVGQEEGAISASYFVAHIEAYQGSSGSAVFNVKTGLVEGILSRGGDDFVERNSCMVSNPCLGQTCDGEDVTRISEVLPYLRTTLAPSSASRLIETDDEVTFSEMPAKDVGVLHKTESPCAHSLSNLKALCSF